MTAHLAGSAPSRVIGQPMFSKKLIHHGVVYVEMYQPSPVLAESALETVDNIYICSTSAKLDTYRPLKNPANSTHGPNIAFWKLKSSATLHY